MKIREFIRHPTDIPIKITMAEVAAKGDEYLNNISLGGLSFKSKVPLDHGTAIDIRIPLVKPIFEAVGQVVWCEKTGEYYNVGVKFVRDQDANLIRMVEQICYIEHYKKEVFEREGRQLTGQEAALEWIRKYADKFPNYLKDEVPGQTESSGIIKKLPSSSSNDA